MKLEEWFLNVAHGDIHKHEIMEDLFVIGTCGECKFIDDIDGPVRACVMEFGLDFGCTHFEKKEG